MKVEESHRRVTMESSYTRIWTAGLADMVILGTG